jgi:hypothetical protein
MYIVIIFLDVRPILILGWVSPHLDNRLVHLVVVAVVLVLV